jgi:YfiH family protein
MNRFSLHKNGNNAYEFTDTRFSIGVIAREGNRTDYTRSKPEIRHNEKVLVSFVSGTDLTRIFFLDQEHADVIIDIDGPGDPDSYCAGAADALVTAESDLCLVIRTADCVPVMMIDPVKNLIAAVHSGWRSGALDISGKTVKYLTSRYGSDPADITAYILPSIGPESYQVSYDVAEKFPGCYRKHDNGYYLNLWTVVEKSLITAGVLSPHIFSSGLCTLIENSTFFSHRAGDIGRNLNFITMKPF